MEQGLSLPARRELIAQQRQAYREADPTTKSTMLDEIIERTGYHRAYAGITLPNPASVATHERLGFEPVGVFKGAGFKLGRWHDVGFWQLALQEAAVPPPPPRPLPELARSPEWEGSLRAAEASLR